MSNPESQQPTEATGSSGGKSRPASRGGPCKSSNRGKAPATAAASAAVGGESGETKNNSSPRAPPKSRSGKRESAPRKARTGTRAAPKETPEVDDSDVCIICTHPIKYQAMGSCDHPTCHICTLRLRALYKNNACPYCKTELDNVIIVPPDGKRYAEYNDQDLPCRDDELGIRFCSQEVADSSFDLLSIRCQWRGCSYVTDSDWAELKKHTADEHDKHMCDLCMRFKKAFAHEHRLFSKPQLTAHYRKGDKTGFTGHPSCEFCHRAFYDNDALFDHCRERHEQCFVCVNNGQGRQQYYRNYQALENHFHKAHFVCNKPECLEKKFVVFDSEIDLKAHMLEEH
ncbi:hypothetical protein BJ085DRAFT_20324, partial [Dimargaris cristalligena]